MGVPFLLHEDHLEVSPTRSTFSFSSLSGLADDRRPLERGGWQATIMGKCTMTDDTHWFIMKPYYVLGFFSLQEIMTLLGSTSCVQVGVLMCGMEITKSKRRRGCVGMGLCGSGGG